MAVTTIMSPTCARESPSRDSAPLISHELSAACSACRQPLMFTMASHDNQTDGAVRERVELKKQEPTLYNVILLNDDYTTMEFVMQILETLFQKSPAEAYRIMMHVHRNGRGLAGVYTYEVAETKAEQVASLASDAGYPLRATVEEA